LIFGLRPLDFFIEDLIADRPRPEEAEVESKV